RDWGLEPEWEPIQPKPVVAPRAQNKIYEVELAEHEARHSEPRVTRAEPSAREERPHLFEADEAAGRREERVAHDEQPTRILRAVPDERAERRERRAPEESRVSRLIEDSAERRREVADRVSFLFPRPETCEWQVPEVGYDRRRRARIDHPVPHAS